MKFEFLKLDFKVKFEFLKLELCVMVSWCGKKSTWKSSFKNLIPVFTWSFLLLWTLFFFVHLVLSSSVEFFIVFRSSSSSMESFIMFSSSSCSDLPVRTILLLPLGSSLRLQFLQNLRSSSCSSDCSYSFMEIKSLRLEIYVG